MSNMSLHIILYATTEHPWDFLCEPLPDGPFSDFIDSLKKLMATIALFAFILVVFYLWWRNKNK